MDHFIETVRRYPCLWNTTAIEYRDQELKDAAWAEVLKETDLSSVKDVKLKWKKLRDSYRDALKRQSEVQTRESSGAGAQGKRTYPWKYSAQMQFLQPYMSNRKRAAPAPAPARNGTGAGAGAGAGGSSPSDSESEPARAPPRPRARAPEPDPLDIFFNGMCQATKRLPFHTQIKIKRSLFEAVTQAEEALVQQQRPYALWGRASSSAPSSEPDNKPC